MQYEISEIIKWNCIYIEEIIDCGQRKFKINNSKMFKLKCNWFVRKNKMKSNLRVKKYCYCDIVFVK